MSDNVISRQMSKYGFDTEYTYNAFHADEHYEVNLWRYTKKGNWKLVDYWSYACGIFPFERSIAHARAERRIKKLRLVYGAEPI